MMEFNIEKLGSAQVVITASIITFSSVFFYDAIYIVWLWGAILLTIILTWFYARWRLLGDFKEFAKFIKELEDAQ